MEFDETVEVVLLLFMLIGLLPFALERLERMLDEDPTSPHPRRSRR